MDIAGLNDTSGVFIDLLSAFLLQKLMQTKLDRVKIILPIQIQSLKNDRGKGVRELFRTIWRLVQGSTIGVIKDFEDQEQSPERNITGYANAIQCVVTHIKPGGDPDELDLVEIQDQIYEVIKSELESELKGADEETAEQIEKMVLQLSQNVIIFDPMNRKIEGYNEDGEQTDLITKGEDLVSKLIDMDFINSSTMNAPLTPDALSNVNGLFDEKYQEISKIIEQQIESAQELG